MLPDDAQTGYIKAVSIRFTYSELVPPQKSEKKEVGCDSYSPDLQCAMDGVLFTDVCVQTLICPSSPELMCACAMLARPFRR